MDKIPNNYAEARMFGDRLREAQLRAAAHGYILDNLDKYTASGKVPANPRTSAARIVSVDAPWYDEAVANGSKVSDLVKGSVANKNEMEILRASEALNKPYTEPTPRTPPPKLTPRGPPSLGGPVGSALLFLDLLTKSMDLNQGEEEQLKKYQVYQWP